MTEPAAPLGPYGAAAAYALVMVLALLLTLWGAFLVPFRVGGTLVPVSWAVALGANAGLGVAGGRLLGKAGALGPVALFLLVAVSLGAKRTEGDLVLLDPTPTYGFLLAGVLGGLGAYGWQTTRLPPAPPR